LAELNAGRRRAARSAIMAMTTRSSIKVNPLVAFAAVRVFVCITIFNVTYDKKIH
jgi:hypothetical protein